MLLSLALSLGLATSLGASPKVSRKKSRPPLVELTTPQATPAPSEADSLFGAVKVGPSQTASWIGFRHLGAWTPEIASKILADNPQISDLDQLQPGQILRLRKSLDQRGLAPAQQISQAIRKAVVTLVKGSAELVRADAPAVPLRANSFLAAGDEISTGTDAVVELIIDNQSVLRLRDKTVLKLVAIQDSGADQKVRTSVFLQAGRVWSKVRKWAGPLVGFQVRMPNAIAGVHGTTFECFVHGDSSSVVQVQEGSVGVSGRANQNLEIAVGAGKSVQINRAGEVSAPSALPGKPSAEDRIDEQREQSIFDQNSARIDDMKSVRAPVGQSIPDLASTSSSASGSQPILKPK